jgi:vacuolar protein sorting-associated protein VTA1
MGSEAEPAKGLLPYLQRADELQKHEPLVAYYCETCSPVQLLSFE